MLFVISPFIVYVCMNLRAYLVHGYLIDGKLEILRHIPLLKTYTNWLYLEELSEIVNEEKQIKIMNQKLKEKMNYYVKSPTSENQSLDDVLLSLEISEKSSNNLKKFWTEKRSDKTFRSCLEIGKSNF